MVISTTPRLGPRCPPVWEQESMRNSLIPCASSGSRSAGSLLSASGLCFDSNSAFVSSVPSYSVSVYLCQLCLPRWTAGGYRQVCIPEFKVLFPWVLLPTRSRVLPTSLALSTVVSTDRRRRDYPRRAWTGSPNVGPTGVHGNHRPQRRGAHPPSQNVPSGESRSRREERRETPGVRRGPSGPLSPGRTKSKSIGTHVASRPRRSWTSSAGHTLKEPVVPPWKRSCGERRRCTASIVRGAGTNRSARWG